MREVLVLAIWFVTYAAAISSRQSFNDLQKIKREINEDGCVLPSHPINGKYKIVQPRSDYHINSIVNGSTFIKLSCNEGYVTSGISFFFCNGNRWEPTFDKCYCVRVYSYNETSERPPILQSSNGCVLPSHPIHGNYTIQSESIYQINSVVNDSTIVALRCNRGYLISGTNFFLCNKNKWEPPLNRSDCFRICPALHSTDGYEVSCAYRDEPRNCSVPIESTTARIQCKPYYFSRGLEMSTCRDGNWDPKPRSCSPACGQQIINVQAPAIGELSSYPWMVVIYKTIADKKEQICGGSIISRFYVLTAAHCFYDQNGVLSDKSEFILAAGKYYRELDKPEEGVQIRKIKELRIHEDYGGAGAKYRADIAVIKVKKFVLTAQVRPVCIDWSNLYEERDFVEDNKAATPYWGYTIDSDVVMEFLKILTVSYKTKDTCQKFVKADFFNRYYSSDKICACFKHENSSQADSVRKADDGAGLFFRSEPTTFYVRALVSLAPRSEVGRSSNHYALYTKVSKYLDWLERITRRRV